MVRFFLTIKLTGFAVRVRFWLHHGVEVDVDFRTALTK
jgi:hypothetical protein